LVEVFRAESERTAAIPDCDNTHAVNGPSRAEVLRLTLCTLFYHFFNWGVDRQPPSGSECAVKYGGSSVKGEGRQRTPLHRNRSRFWFSMAQSRKTKPV
jgi:hypothetical protein